MDSEHLFDQILFAFDIEPMARRGDSPDNVVPVTTCRRAQFETIKDVADFDRRDLLTDQVVQPPLAQAYDLGAWQMGRTGRLDDRPRLPSDQVKQETRCTFHGLRLKLEVHAALVAVGGVRVQAEPPRRRRDPKRVEVCTLEKDVACRGSDAAAVAAHDPGDGDRSIRVRDQKRTPSAALAVADGDFPVVEERQRLARTGIAHDDAAT